MRFSVLLATSALVLGVASSANAEGPSFAKIQGSQNAAGFGVVNIDANGAVTDVLVSQEAWSTHFNVKSHNEGGNFAVKQVAKNDATISGELTNWNKTTTFLADVTAGGTSSIDAEMSGTVVELLTSQKAGGDTTLKAKLGGALVKGQSLQITDSSAYMDFKTLTDTSVDIVFGQEAGGNAVANFDSQAGFSPNYVPRTTDYFNPFKN
jgi:hypothetical protein